MGLPRGARGSAGGDLFLIRARARGAGRGAAITPHAARAPPGKRYEAPVGVCEVRGRAPSGGARARARADG